MGLWDVVGERRRFKASKAFSVLVEYLPRDSYSWHNHVRKVEIPFCRNFVYEQRCVRDISRAVPPHILHGRDRALHLTGAYEQTRNLKNHPEHDPKLQWVEPEVGFRNTRHRAPDQFCTQLRVSILLK